MLGALQALFHSHTARPDPHILEMRQLREVTHVAQGHVAG